MHPSSFVLVVKAWRSCYQLPSLKEHSNFYSPTVHTLPETNIAPGNGWLEYYRFLLGPGLFSGAFWLVSSSVSYVITILKVSIEWEACFWTLNFEALSRKSWSPAAKEVQHWMLLRSSSLCIATLLLSGWRRKRWDMVFFQMYFSDVFFSAWGIYGVFSTPIFQMYIFFELFVSDVFFFWTI